MGAATIVLAAGSGVRLGRSGSKVLEPVGGRPLLAYCLDVVARVPGVDTCVVVIRSRDGAGARQVIGSVPGLSASMVEGGATRHGSERAGLAALRRRIAGGEVDVVAIHDAARPFATRDLFERVIAAARRTGGAVPGLGFDEPLYERSPGGLVAHPPGGVVRVQTPQAFRAVDLLGAYDVAPAGFESVDTSETVERFGSTRPVVVPGDPRNLKVTLSGDLMQAEELTAEWDRRGRWTTG